MKLLEVSMPRLVPFVLIVLLVLALACTPPEDEQATSSPEGGESTRVQETKATATPALAPNQAKIGDLFLQVNGWAAYSEPNQFLRAEAGTHYVAVDVSYKNVGDKDYGLNVNNFKLKDTAGFTTGSASTTLEPRLGHVDMVAGQEGRSYIIFKLGDGRSPVELQYQSFTGTPGIIKF
jgi:hypothetical protein